MREPKTYTDYEIKKNISILEGHLDGLLNERKAINSSISDTRKQIQFWLDIDESQYKMF